MEVLETRGNMLAVVGTLFVVLLAQCKGLEGSKNSSMSYVCPPHFMRLGHSCYYFSKDKASWHNALFACKDKFSNLSVPARWEDRNLRTHLTSKDLEKATRWIGGVYDYSSKGWKWGGELRNMPYQSFSKMKKMTPEQLQWHCIAMAPELMYRWAPRSCLEQNQYICQTKLRKVHKSEVIDLRRRYQRMGKLNEISVPGMSTENNDPKLNDVTINPFANPKSFDLGPAALKSRLQQDDPGAGAGTMRVNSARRRGQRPRPHISRRLKKPFRGYRWNRRDPEGSYRYNANLLRSGKTGLRPRQVHAQLVRLKDLRDRQIRKRDRGDWLVNDTPNMLSRTHAKTYTLDNNISALHPKTIVEEFDMMLPPAVIPRPTNTAW